MVGCGFGFTVMVVGFVCCLWLIGGLLQGCFVIGYYIELMVWLFVCLWFGCFGGWVVGWLWFLVGLVVGVGCWWFG